MIEESQNIGYIAATLTTLAHIPQCVKIYSETYKDNSLSLSTYILLWVGLLFWLLYGLSIKALPIIVANSLSLMLSTLIIFRILYLKKYGKKAEEEED